MVDGRREGAAMSFDSPKDPRPTCEECPKFKECDGPHFCQLAKDKDAYVEVD